MTAKEISNTITNCLVLGLDEERIGKRHIEDAIDSLVPLLGAVATLERDTEYRLLVKSEEGINACTVSGERLKIKWVESFTSKEKALHTESKRLSKSLDMALSALQSRLRVIDLT